MNMLCQKKKKKKEKGVVLDWAGQRQIREILVLPLFFYFQWIFKVMFYF